jgi:hypothetical protein
MTGTAALMFQPWTAANGNTYTVMSNPADVPVYKVVTEAAPTADVDFENERLTGLTPSAVYKINGAERTADGAGSIPLGEFIPKAGEAARTLSLVRAGGTASVDSAAQEAITIPRRPATPEVKVTRQPTSATAPNDTGAIMITSPAPSAAYEYGPLDLTTGPAVSWDNFPSTTPSEITGLSHDIYYARVKATGTSFASDSRSFQIYAFDTIDFGGVYVGYEISDNPDDTRGANKAVTQRVRVEAGETITDAQWVDDSEPTPLLLSPQDIDNLPFTLAGSAANWTVRPKTDLPADPDPYEARLMVTYSPGYDTVNLVSLQVHPRAEIESVEQSGTDAKGATNEITVTFARPISLAYTDVTVDGAAVKTIGTTSFVDVSSDETVYKIAVTPLMDHKTGDDINVRINIDGDDLRPAYYFQNSNGEHGVAGSASVAIPRAIASAEAVTPIPGYSTGYIQFTLDRDLCPIDTAAIEEGSVEIRVGGTPLPPDQIFRIDADMGYTFRLRITPIASGNVTLAIPGFGIAGTFAVEGSVATGRALTDNAFFLSENGSNYLTGDTDARQTLNPVNAYDGRTPAYAAPAMDLRVNREYGDGWAIEFYIDGKAYDGYSTSGGGSLNQIFDGVDDDDPGSQYPDLANYLKITLPAGWTSDNGTHTLHAVLTKGDESVLLFAKTEVTGITPRYALTVTGGTGGGLYPAGAVAPIQGVLPAWNAEFLGWTQAAQLGDAGYISELPAEISGAVVMPAGDAALTALYTRPSPAPNGGTGSGGGAGGSAPPAQPPAQPQRTVSQADISHISGADRVLTAVAVSRTGWSRSDTVVLAPGAQANLIDALAADPYAGQLGAPVLLGMGETPDPAVVAEIQRLGAANVVVVGALGDAYIAALQAALPGVKIEILRGGNRLETALLLAGKIENPRGAIVVGYDALADAVSVASWAAAHSYLIIPAGPDGSFTPPENLALPAAEGAANYIIGGPTLVRDIPGYTRIYGADRYATNLLIRQTLDFKLDLVYTANGVTIVDALTGAPLAAKTNSPIVLLRDGDLAGADFGDITAETRVFAFGG